MTCCSVPRGNRTGSPAIKSTSTHHEYNLVTYKDMARIPGGTFLMGTNQSESNDIDAEGPIREVMIDPFYIDYIATTNNSFNKFIRETKYVTEAEKFGWSFVFHLLIPKEKRSFYDEFPAEAPWWKKVEGANWKHPEGPGSKINLRMHHPAVHISWNDAMEYCNWSRKRLPSEAEWEFAARGGLIQKIYPWGDELVPLATHMCNIWQGTFPDENTEDDGFIGTAPSKHYKPNNFGLYNMVGNIWEWQSNWYGRSNIPKTPQKNPKGPSHGTSKSIRGGSYLCHDSYCNRYRVAARSSNTPDSSTGNLGFRCASD